MQQQLKNLPIGESDIGTILNPSNNFSYVDKTTYVYELIKIPSKYFLSRPRRFGKSTLLSTINEIFKGNKELFKKQWIYTSPWDWQEYPIIRLDFNTAISNDLVDYIKDALKEIAIKYNVFDEKEYLESPYNGYFRKLIIHLYNKYNKQVVILVDEYDKPILDVIDKLAEAEKQRDILKGFYGVIKGADEYVRFVFLTGVTRFSKVGVFSDLNNLNDITNVREYASICGITQQELETNYKEHIEQLKMADNISHQECLAKIKEWYNGFCFSKDTNNTVYNPFSTLQFLQKKEYSNYWFQSGSPSFLIKLIKKQQYVTIPELDNYVGKSTDFDTFEIDNLDIIAILLQAGYLTIKDYNQELDYYTLGYPNKEINQSFKTSLIKLFSYTPVGANNSLLKIIFALNSNNLDIVMTEMKQIFLNIDYDIKISQEKHFQNIFYLIFQLLGFDINVEYKTNSGRIDAIIQTKNNIFIFEFKMDKTAIEALEQIKQKSYYERFISQNKPIILIGANFNTNIKNIDDYIVENILLLT